MSKFSFLTRFNPLPIEYQAAWYPVSPTWQACHATWGGVYIGIQYRSHLGGIAVYGLVKGDNGKYWYHCLDGIEDYQLPYLHAPHGNALLTRLESYILQ